MRTRRSLCSPLLVALALAGCGTTPEDLNPLDPPLAPLKDVELVVDDLGITHVYAQSDEDAFFGAGYAMARDRLFHMELTRRKAIGRSAELIGERGVRGDIAARAMNFAKLGAADFARAKKEKPEDAGLVEAWARGVNQRIAEVKRGDAARPWGLGPEELDFVPEDWTPEHAYAVGKLLAFGLSNSLDAELLATAILRIAPGTAERLPILMPAFDTFILNPPPQEKPAPAPKPKPPLPKPAAPKGFPATWEPIFPALASNNWAVTAEHSDNGRPLLAGDPHQPTTSPARFWPVHMSSVEGGGTLDVIGFAFVGTPSVELGHNAHIGWTATTNYADVMDLWDVPAGGTWQSVKLGGESRPIATRSEVIRVRSEGGAIEERTIDIHDVPGYGVILPDEILPIPSEFLADGALLFNWTGFQPTTEGASYVAIDRAKNVEEFEAAVDTIEVGALNFVAADTKDVLYHVHARVPDRGDPSARPMPWRALPGKDPESFWVHGDLGPDKLPHLKNPERGFVCSGNNDPFGFVADGSVENDPYYYGTFYATGFRPYRMDKVLSAWLAQRKVGRADMEELQRDTRSAMADTLLPHLKDAIDALPSDPALAAWAGRDDLTALADRLFAWDRRFDRSQSAPVIFFAFEWFAAQRMFEGPLTSALFSAIGDKSPPFLMAMLRNVVEERFPDAKSFVPDGKRALLLGALSDTSAWLKQRFGGIDAAFAQEDVHGCEFTAEFPGKYEVPIEPVHGSLDTVNVSQAPFFKDGAPRDTWVSHETSLYRMVIAFADDGTPEATFDFTRGASGEPDSPHFDDQVPLWRDAGHTPLPFREADVAARATERATLRGRR